MTRGCLIFAHNGNIDYGSQAVLAANLVNKHLRIPTSLVTDNNTLVDTQAKFNQLPFDQIIKIEKPVSTNTRMLKTPDGKVEVFDFINTNRVSAYELSPYDQTLVIDSDYLVFSNSLNRFWDSGYDFLITPGMLDLTQEYVTPKNYAIYDYSITMLWATCFMFNKTPEVKILFDLVDYVKQEYFYFSQLYHFNPYQFRNDFAFSVACHIMSGYGLYPWHGELPVPMMIKDIDQIVNINNDRIAFLSMQGVEPNDHLVQSRCQDVHCMNKKDILKYFDKFMEIAK